MSPDGNRVPPINAVYFLGAIVSGAIGGAIALAIFGPKMLLGSEQYWTGIIGDNAASLIGYYALAHDSWRWPLLQTELINFPHGANIYFTDSVPFMAILGKILFQYTGTIYIYFGVWILISYVLMGVFGYLLFRFLKLDVIAAVTGSTLLILLPEFIWRHVHIGLVAQFVIVASIYAYIRMVSTSNRSEMFLISASVSLVITINAYLFAMCAPLIIAALCDAWRLQRIQMRYFLFCLMGMFLSSCLVMLALGLIGKDTSLPITEGFGTFSMNLASPFWPQYSLLSFGRGFLDPVGGQYEGFNYLGAGVLSLLVLSLALKPAAYLRLIRRHAFLASALAALVIFAISSRIYVGPYKILEVNYDLVPVLGRITATFRSSGRFFWPVGFVIVICAVVIVYRRLGPRRATPLMMCAVLVQIIDIWPVFKLARADSIENTRRLDPEPGLTLDLIGSRSAVLFVPGALCGSRKNINVTVPMQFLAARAGRPFDGPYLNRGGASCGELAQSFAADPFRGVTTPRALLVLMKEAVGLNLLTYGLGPDVQCREGQYAYFCGRAPLDEKLLAFGRAPDPPPPLPLGVNLDPSGNGAAFLGTGWSVRSPVYRWAEGDVTTFLGRLPQEACKEVRFSAEIVPFGFKGYAVDIAEVRVRDGGSAPLRLDRMGQQRIDVTLPLERCVDHVDLGIMFKDPKSPLALGMNSDPRRVTWGFFNYRIEAR